MTAGTVQRSLGGLQRVSGDGAATDVRADPDGRAQSRRERRQTDKLINLMNRGPGSHCRSALSLSAPSFAAARQSSAST